LLVIITIKINCASDLNLIIVSSSLRVNEMKEVWKFVNYISTEMPEARARENEIVESIREIRKDVKGISERLGEITG
jgi:hypothetical protein